MAAKPGTAAAMRAYWEDPVWRARQIDRIAKAAGTRPKKRMRGDNTYVSFGIDLETYAILRAKASAQNTSIPELVRTFIQWGLDNDD